MHSPLPLTLDNLMGKSKHIITIASNTGFKLEEIELLELAAHYFLTELDKRKNIGIIHGEITISSEILAESDDVHLYGDMEELHNQVLDNGEIGNYYICRVVDYTNSVDTLRTLAHELVHVWQTENGSLNRANKEWVWKGKSYGTHPYDGSDADDLLPWEIEAAKLDLKLVKLFYKTYFLNW